MTDSEYMEKAVIIAESNTDPITNQSVGAIIVKDDTIIGTGCRHIFHNFCGYKHKTVHGEHMALMEAGDLACGATIYVTMEPCAKRWCNSVSWNLPSCCDLISKYGIKRVVIGSMDERFGRDGMKKLQSIGIEVDICLDFEDRIKSLCKNVKVDPILQEEFNRFINE